MKARLLPPRENYSGNLLWNKREFIDEKAKIEKSLEKLREIGYWASPFPEGDGITFNIYDDSIKRNGEEMLADFQECFDWVVIEKTVTQDSNSELSKLEDDERNLDCIVIVPLEKVYFQKTLTLGKYTFFCKKIFDENPYERLADFECEYLQFEIDLKYKDLLRINNSIKHNDHVIKKCLSLAEHAMDIVRYSHSSFLTPEFTPNPAGQTDDGFYSVNIIPLGETHLKPFELSGISKPISVSNNWLGPQVDDFFVPGIDYLSFIYGNEFENEMAKAVISALRSCRQSFYSIGNESQFLNLVFTLDGLADPDWNGWKHRTYIASLLSGGDPASFGTKLEEYDRLYTDVRNKLVHEGKDFYQLSEGPDNACETIYGFIKDVIGLIASIPINTVLEMKNHAIGLLKTRDFKDEYTRVINRVSASRGKQPNVPQW
ncbi:hypothetical protein [Marinobacter arenosus]|uniref:hypothetical protein n=1 Tax=Marinobacter arenosus TaxID=2856822 RepID=UPI001C4BD2FE|nr:hypothetical protein [Marinobacter arenosus]MBW0147229.1 hypothetical protein [Marinobacter arenosus]